MKHSNFLCLLTLYTCFARDPPMVTIPNQGTIVGKEISMIRTQRILGYLGIPYAHPPVERLRFAPPVTEPMPRWDGVRNATEYAPACLQGSNDFNKLDLPFLQLISDLQYTVDEDCLYLNVFVPFGGYPPAEGFATIVWFHPGNFTTGNPAMWNPYTLVYRQRVIVVTFAYRLNIMGFYTSNDGEAPGNYGVMDQQAALIWVKNNIKLFNGNPDNISLMGYGSGAVSIGLHMINQQSRGLFAKAIMMSGNFLNPSSVKLPQEDKGLTAKLTANFGCNPKPTTDLVKCLRRAPAEALVALTAYIDWRPLIDAGLSNSTPFLPEYPKAFFERGDYYKVPILTGFTQMEEVLGVDSLDQDSASDQDFNSEYIPALLTEIVGKDFQVPNNSEACVYNYDHIMDSVLFFYGPSPPISDLDKARRLVADFITEKNIGSSTYMHATYASKDQTTYMYRFDMKPSTPGATAEIAEWVSVPHLFDLIYVWGIPYWPTFPNQDWEWHSHDKGVSDIIMSFWTNFAKVTNLSENSIFPIRWDPFTKQEPLILIIDRSFSMSNMSTFNYKAFEFWNDYYPKVVTVATQCCNATDVASTPHKSVACRSLIYVVSSILIAIISR